ncbi:MAG: AMP-binding protein [Prevotella sp.]
MTLNEFLEQWQSADPTLPVHTSGSTGKPKLLRVEKERMRASARMTCRFLNLKPQQTALLCMPLDYIAGKMMVVRALEAHLQLWQVPPSSHPLATLQQAPHFAAMVPLQVFHSMQEPRERQLLMQIHHLIIGGGAINEEMEAQLQCFPHAVWSTYGMTETLSHIALRRLNGKEASTWYTPLPTVSVSLNEEECLVIDAPEVCAAPLVTNDRAVLSANGTRFRILGRRDNIINSGGIKIQIEEVERLLSPVMPVPFLITQTPHVRYGEAVTLLYESKCADSRLLSAVCTLCSEVLPRYWKPKVYLRVEALPHTPTGKPARAEAHTMACALLESLSV